MTEQRIDKNLPYLLELAREVEKEHGRGVEAHVVDGIVMMSPMEPVHFRTQDQINDQLKQQVEAGWTVLGESEFAHPTWDRKRTPDLYVWDGDEEDNMPFDPEHIGFVIEVVSRSSVENDYIHKPRAYAGVGIDAYLILDPYTRAWTLMTDPGPSGYRERATGAYGKTLVVAAGDREYQVVTEGLPEAKLWQQIEAWPVHRTDPHAAS
ncbi:Uma2 family endonuclease [Streptomyces beijiangensis]|uniref:Uma2 family endonuclease n=1 Tax=Streptomyces beijiangensis TaxID=163361 RepID=A0A939F5J4_9ACTN|nr:Uma2 family endonuclease [Streptomyces beijiangensis]MBO0512291.1 Uma2 family endonuclease [Streptomyces beijiangensis]